MKYYLILCSLILIGINSNYNNNNNNIFKGGNLFNKDDYLLNNEDNKGCCYDVGFGKLMIPIYNNHNDTYKMDCKTIKRLGGSTEFSKLNCSKLKLLQVNKVNHKKDF